MIEPFDANVEFHGRSRGEHPWPRSSSLPPTRSGDRRWPRARRAA